MIIVVCPVTSVEISHPSYDGVTTLSDDHWRKAKRLVGIIGYHANMADNGCGYPKVEAIKLLRDMTGLGLKESKVAIEAAWQEKDDHSF